MMAKPVTQPKGSHPLGEIESSYSVEVIAELAGVDTRTVLHYHEIGVISPVSDDMEFDEKGLRHLCRLEQLRESHNLSDGGLKLIAELLEEIELLREERRRILR